MIDFSLPNMGDMKNANAAQLKIIGEYLQQLSEQLRYELSHVDEQNMTASMVASLNKASENVDAMTLQQFVAGLRLELVGNTLVLKSRDIELNAVNIGRILDGYQQEDETAAAAFEALYPVGTLYKTTDTATDISELLPYGTWSDVTPTGETSYKEYERIEDLIEE